MVLDALEATRTFAILVRDENGARVQGVPVEWEVEDPSIATVSSIGTVEAVANGTTRVTARFEDLETTVTLHVQQVARQVEAVGGTEQRVSAGSPLPDPVTVQATDRLGHPVPGALVEFDASLGGAVDPATLQADSAGFATARWTLGPEPGLQHLAVTVGERHRFFILAEAEDETGRVPFRIRTRLLADVTEEVAEALTSSIARWEALLVEKLSPVLVRVGEGQCGDDAPALDQVVDDILILVAVEEMDGPEGLVARANPCFLRESDLLPVAGQLRLDRADMDTLAEANLLEDVITHEIAHVLGFGALWEVFELLKLASLPDDRGADTHFDGPRAIAAFDAVGGRDYDGAKVPVENEIGGEGTRDRHWRESVLAGELLTGLLSATEPNPLSRITLASLEDLGYSVDLEGADPFSLSDAQTMVAEDELFRIFHEGRPPTMHILAADGTIARTVRP